MPDQPVSHSLSESADDGLPDPRLEAALYAWATGEHDDPALRQEAIEAFRIARVYVPAISPTRDTVGMVALRRADGVTAIAVFTGIERLVAWRGEARPVPHIGSVVASMADEDGHTMCVVDIDGPITATLPLAVLLG